MNIYNYLFSGREAANVSTSAVPNKEHAKKNSWYNCLTKAPSWREVAALCALITVAVFQFAPGPGWHSLYGPVLGSRADELKGIFELIDTNKGVMEFEKSLYQAESLQLIPHECKECADQIANKLFAELIDPYRGFGFFELNEENAIDWESRPLALLESPGAVEIYTSQWYHHVLYAHAIVNLNNRFTNHYVPPKLIAYHEFMHVQEIIPNQSRSSHTLGIELLPSLTTRIQLDEIFKKCKGIPLSEEVDYGQTINVKEQKLPLGRVVNCYRNLTDRLGSLFQAFISENSMHFLKTGKCSIETDLLK